MLKQCYYCEYERSCEQCNPPRLTTLPVTGTDAVTLRRTELLCYVCSGPMSNDFYLKQDHTGRFRTCHAACVNVNQSTAPSITLADAYPIEEDDAKD
jgi:hypothetical protein